MTLYPRTPADAEEAAAARESRELVRALYLSLKSAQLYPDTAHPGFVRPLEALAKAMDAYLQRRGPFALTLVGDYVFLAGRRIRFDAEGYLHVAYLSEVFGRCGIGGITVVALPGAELIGRALRILQAVPQGTPPGASALGAALKEQGAAGIDFLPTQVPIEVGNEISFAAGREAAAWAYARALGAARDLFAKARAQAPLDLLRAKRATLSLADIILRGEPAVLALTALKDPRDYLARHAVNVCILALAAGQHIGYHRAGLAALGLAGFLHDLGKMRWPPDLDQKPPPLSPDDHRWIGLYPVYSAVTILRQSELSDAAILAARAGLDHTRHVDLSGSPILLRRSAPSLAGQIVSVAHHFDARTSSRVYDPKSLRPEEAWAEIIRHSGTWFDPLALLALKQAVGTYPPGTLVLLTTGEVALVLAPPPGPEAALRPPILLIQDAEGNRLDGPTLNFAVTEAGGTPRAIVRSVDPREVGVRLDEYLLPGPLASTAAA